MIKTPHATPKCSFHAFLFLGGRGHLKNKTMDKSVQLGCLEILPIFVIPKSAASKIW